MGTIYNLFPGNRGFGRERQMTTTKRSCGTCHHKRSMEITYTSGHVHNYTFCRESKGRVGAVSELDACEKYERRVGNEN